MNKKGICKICGKSNNCALVYGKAPESCWCTKVKFTKEIMDELKRRNIENCICENCYKKLKDDLKIDL